MPFSQKRFSLKRYAKHLATNRPNGICLFAYDKLHNGNIVPYFQMGADNQNDMVTAMLASIKTNPDVRVFFMTVAELAMQQEFQQQQAQVATELLSDESHD